MSWKSRIPFFVVMLTVVGTMTASAQTADVASSDTQSWASISQLIRDGKFDEARQRIDNWIPNEADTSRIAEWIDNRLELEKERSNLTHEDFDKYVAKAKEYREKGKITKALDYALRAFSNTQDKDAFRKQAWVAGLKADAMIKASEFMDKHEWLEAHAIYYDLNELDEHDKQVRQLQKECLSHARLEEIYKDENPWQDGLEGIDPEMATDAFWEIERRYVEEANFRDMTINALDHMLLLAESPALSELFERLRDEKRSSEFQGRIKRVRQHVFQEEDLTGGQAEDVFKLILRINRQTIQLPEELITYEYMESALDELDDFTTVIWPADFKTFQKNTRGNFIGVGIQISQQFNPDNECKEIVVVTPIEDSPAYRAGIQVDDVIREVNGESLCEMEISLNKAVELITGPEGTPVTLTIFRPSEDKEIEFPLIRKEVEIQSVKGHKRNDKDPQQWDFMLDKNLGIGYIRLTTFGDNTDEQLYQAITDLKKKHNLRGLILDLRFNPGGLLNTAADISEMFLDKGDRIVSTEGMRSKKWSIAARRDGAFRDLPLIVLVNEYSASASEIFAGAIRDHNRGLLIGERTFGKFSVQNLIQIMRSDAHLKLTTAHYYLPNGDSLHREENSTSWGVEPDVEVFLVPKELRKVIEMRRDADIIETRKDKGEEKLAQADQENEEKKLHENKKPASEPEKADPATEKPADAENKADSKEDSEKTEKSSDDADEQEEEEEPDPNNHPEVDPQLETALLLMRLELLDDDPTLLARLDKVQVQEAPTN